MKYERSGYRRVIILPFLILWVWAQSAVALEPPRPGEIQALKRKGLHHERVQRAKALGNHKLDPYRLKRALQEAKRNFLYANGGSEEAQDAVLPAPPPRWQGMPTTGTVKTFILLISFSDYANTVSAADIDSMLYGSGNPAHYPLESLTAFYDRSSYGLLDLEQGTTLGWYNTGYPRTNVPQTAEGRENLIKEALDHFNDEGHDFTRYDNNDDGEIDYFMVAWTGPDNGWANFWWGYHLNFA